MNKATIDLTNCKYLGELHQRIKVGLNFSDGYGENLYAFWDFLHRECEYDHITIIGADTVAEELKETVEEIKRLFQKDKEYWAAFNHPVHYEFV